MNIFNSSLINTRGKVLFHKQNEQKLVKQTKKGLLNSSQSVTLLHRHTVLSGSIVCINHVHISVIHCPTFPSYRASMESSCPQGTEEEVKSVLLGRVDRRSAGGNLLLVDPPFLQLLCFGFLFSG